MRITLSGSALALALATSSPALADQAPSPAVDRAQADARYAPVTHHDFRGETVDGRTRNPDGALVEGHARAPLGSLISVRADFRVELLRSADDL